ncbi:cinnamoyl-CoA reductase 1-like isoform X2 [Diospyros lotus]|uniref:cinnamoyl-CoA reductase 1-like isoform X2 n=1 Tax=Diospyros lotus TaxID=55363 RepID=UPI0022550512|nr:cinnamoyl-CoA reductase 1-like isoform X2 [Diospyros lotus]
MAEKGRVCVTGAGGYVASWLVKLLLSNGYTVHGTVRDPHDEKNAHLMKFEKASENLKLFKVDLLDRSSVSAAIKGCDGVFHVASPVPPGSVPNPEVQLIEPAVKGTLNVLEESSEANVKRVVFVSSAAAVSMNPAWPEGQVKDEACWSDKEYCRKTNNWYCLSKTEAESEALEFAKRSGLDVVRVCPTHVLGPKLQSSTNASILVLIKLLKGYLWCRGLPTFKIRESVVFECKLPLFFKEVFREFQVTKEEPCWYQGRCQLLFQLILQFK